MYTKQQFRLSLKLVRFAVGMLGCLGCGDQMKASGFFRSCITPYNWLYNWEYIENY